MRPTSAIVALAVTTCWPLTAIAQGDASWVETQAAPPRDMNSQARVSAAELETTSPRTADDLLRAVPGLVVVQHGNEGKGLQFYLRGFDAVHGSDFAVSVEGVPLNEFSNVHGHGYVDLGFIVPEAVAHLDVTRGAYALSQGNFATAGEVDVGLGAAPWDRGASVSYEIGTTNRHRLTAMSAGGRGEVLAAELLFDAGFGEGRESLRAGVTSRQRIASAANARLDAVVIAGASRFELPGAVRLDDVESGRVGFYDSYSVGTGETTRALVATPLRGKASWGRFSLVPYVMGRTLALEENFTGSLRDPQRGDRRRQDEASLVGGARLQLALTQAVPGTMRVVAGTRHNRVQHTEDAVLDDGTPWNRDRELDAVIHHTALGLGWDHMFGPFGVTLGARSELFDYRLRGGGQSEQLAVVVPRAAVRLLVGDATMFAAAGQGYRAPEARAVFAPPLPPGEVRDDADLFDGGEPSVSIANNVEVGARYYWPAAEVGLTGFGIQVDREVVFDHVSGVNLELAGTRRLGAELDAEIRPLSLLQFAADLTLVDARFRTSGNAVPGAPQVLGTVRAFAGRPGTFRAGVSATYLGPRPLPHGAEAADSVLVGVTASGQFGAFEFGVDVDNALGQQFRDGEVHFASSWDREQPRSSLPAIHLVAGPPLSARFHITARFGSQEGS